MEAAIARLKTAIIADFAKWGKGGEYYQKQVARMESGEILSHEIGQKYIKIVRDGGVWGFVVNVHDDAKFKYGDILLAASWGTPARNQARGNVFEEYAVSWTGPLYLR